MKGSQRIQRLGEYLGLVENPAGRPRQKGRGMSRYGSASRRLDEDVDDLRARVEVLEQRLGEEDSTP